MKKILFAIICAVASITATAQENKIAVNAGFLFPSTLNATVGYESSFTYGNAVEVYGEIGNHWKSGEGQFWKGYYWDGGHNLQTPSAPLQERQLPCPLRPSVRSGGEKVFHRYRGRAFEYNYVFQNGCEFSIIQKNNVNFLHGDTFRNGLMLGFKIPF